MFSNQFLDAAWIEGDLDASLFACGISLRGYRHHTELNSL